MVKHVMSLHEKVRAAVELHRLSYWFITAYIKAGRSVVIDGRELRGEEALRAYFRSIYTCTHGVVEEEELDRAFQIFKEMVERDRETDELANELSKGSEKVHFISSPFAR